MTNLFLILRTLVHLKPAQFWFQVWRRLQRKLGPHPACSTEELPEFTFLNLTVRPKGWNDASLDMLWRYNLHYFDGIGGVSGEKKVESGEKKVESREKKVESGEKKVERTAGLVLRWIKENPRGSVPGWDPYPTSLRIVNWAKFLGEGLGRRSGSAEMEASLAEQVDWLAGHLEYQILANHYLANLKAMVIGCAALGRDYGKWLKRYLKQIDEQVLPDGGHYERSVMYHAIILEDVLDVIRFCGEKAAALRPVAGRMLRYLVAMTGPDGKIAMFNDAADGIAKPTAWLVEYAASLEVTLPADPPGTAVWDFPATGYARIACGEFVLFVDAAPVGPDYQPGHAHADTLTYELYWRGRKVVSDAGTSEYRGRRRAFERSSGAHNVVVVDGRDSSEVWGSHRVGRRARIVRRAWSGNVLEAEYSSVGVRVSRRWRLTERGLEVTERVTGARSAETRIHFAAGEDSSLALEAAGGDVARMTYERALEFGKVESAVCCRIPFDPQQAFVYRIGLRQ